MRTTCQPLAYITLLFRRVCYLCGLRFTRKKHYVIMLSAAVFITYLQATLGCVPALIPMRPVRGICQPPARITVLFRRVPKLCGLRFTRNKHYVIMLSAAVF